MIKQALTAVSRANAPFHSFGTQVSANMVQQPGTGLVGTNRAGFIVYWVTFGLMAGSAVIFAGLTFMKPQRHRKHGCECASCFCLRQHVYRPPRVPTSARSNLTILASTYIARLKLSDVYVRPQIVQRSLLRSLQSRTMPW